MTAVTGSGTTIMSLAWIACQPRMLDPSKPSPSSKISGTTWLTGIEKCCHVPGKSWNLRSRISMFLALIRSMISFGVMDGSPRF